MKYWYLFPFGFIFVSPWLLRLSAENIKAALPAQSVSDPVHAAFILSLSVMITIGFIVFVRNAS